MIDRKHLPAFSHPIPYVSDHHVQVKKLLCRNTGNKNLQIKRKDHILNHQTNDVVVTEERKKKIDQVSTQLSRMQLSLSGKQFSKRNHLLYHFSIITIHLHLASFYAQNTFKKNSKRKCSLNELLNLNWGSLGPPGRTYAPITD